MTAAARAFWEAFASASGVKASPATAFKFGDSPEMADELVRLVLEGRKRATAGLFRSFSAEEPLPVVGEYAVVLDGGDVPRCIIVTRQVEIKALSQADDAFAWDEGEGDRTLGWWMKAHVAYFEREAARGGFEMHPNIETVFERFDVVWPPADSRSAE